MVLGLEVFERGVQEYWQEIARRAPHIQARERAFPALSLRYASRTPQHFIRDDLRQIMEWKHTDIRWFNRAMKGIEEESDEKIIRVTSGIAFDVTNTVRPDICKAN